jgi:hypothetical protein
MSTETLAQAIFNLHRPSGMVGFMTCMTCGDKWPCRTAEVVNKHTFDQTSQATYTPDFPTMEHITALQDAVAAIQSKREKFALAVMRRLDGLEDRIDDYGKVRDEQGHHISTLHDVQVTDHNHIFELEDRIKVLEKKDWELGAYAQELRERIDRMVLEDTDYRHRHQQEHREARENDAFDRIDLAGIRSTIARHLDWHEADKARQQQA